MSGAPGLVGRTRKLGPAFDLIATYRPGGFFLERSGIGVSSSGIATRVGADGGPGRIRRLATLVESALREVRMEGEGPAPVAVGAIPFDEGWPADLAIPSRTVRRERRGETCRLDVWPQGLAPLDADRERWTGRTAPHDAFEEIQLRPDPEPDDYAAAVREATRRIRRGRLRKVVLARSIEVDAGRELDPKQLLWRLRAVDPDCYAFATSEMELERDDVRPTRSLVGASPELLVAKRGSEVRADPLAGSAPRLGDPEGDRASGDALLASVKDREEHAVVVEAVSEALRGLCDEVQHPSEPDLLGTANVWHLSTPFRGRLRADVRSVLEVVASLHPTPAVCGAPREAAREALSELESIDRGLYAGPVGWVDANGDGEWAIALRCAEIAGTTARLFAGAGIVAGSIPEQELDETERKFRALLDSLRWG